MDGHVSGVCVWCLHRVLHCQCAGPPRQANQADEGPWSQVLLWGLLTGGCGSLPVAVAVYRRKGLSSGGCTSVASPGCVYIVKDLGLQA